MLLGDELTPVSQLSGAFLNPKTPIHLQFAYFESSLVVEHLVERYGIEVVKKILDDLGNGLMIEDALAQNVGSLEKLDAEFADFARGVAESFGSAADWSKESLPERPSEQELKDWVQKNPNSYWGLRGLAEIYVASGEFEPAKEVLEKLIEFGAVTGESGDPLSLLARVYAELGESEKERQVLERRIALTSNALPALRRLIDLSRESQQWDRVAMFAEQVLAINPLLPEGHEALAEASEALERPRDAMRGLRALAKMDPVDPAAIDFKLARAHWQLKDREQARHHVLRALEEAPRYRDAHRLLLELSESDSPANDPDATPAPDSAPEPVEASR
jgi:tetratricopeptide (TPR) repeat protein